MSVEDDELMKLLRAGKAKADDQRQAANWIAQLHGIIRERNATIDTAGNVLKSISRMALANVPPETNDEGDRQ